MANQRWYKGAKPTKMERFLHSRMNNNAWELVYDWISRGVIQDAADVDTIVEEIQDLAETGNSIMT